LIARPISRPISRTVLRPHPPMQMLSQVTTRLASMALVWLVLLAWHIAGPHIGWVGNALFVILISIPVAMSGAETAFYRRHAFRREYLKPDNWLHRLMGMEPLILGWEAIKALALTLLLMIGTLTLDMLGWSLLLAVVLVLSLLMPRLPGLLHGVVRPPYIYAMARRWAIWLSTSLLWLEAIVVLLSAGDDYRGLSWWQIVDYATRPVGVECQNGLVCTLLRLDTGVDTVASWSVNVLLKPVYVAADSIAAAMALCCILAFWLLMALAYSRALMGMMARPLEIWRPRPGRSANGNLFETWWL
jgi:hypothetical protein